MSDLGRRTAPFRDYGFTPPQPSLARESAFTRDQQTQLERSSQVDLDRDDLSLGFNVTTLKAKKKLQV